MPVVIENSHALEVQAYIDGVLDGSIVAGKLVRACVERHQDDLVHGAGRGLHFDAEAASGAIEFFYCLNHSTGEWVGQPFAPYPWQKFLLWVLFGWKRSDGTRRFRDAFISIGRGNGKSPLGAGIGLLLFACDQPVEARAEVYTAATKKDQARIVFDEARRMVDGSQFLREYITTLRSNMHIVANGSKMEPLGSDSKNVDGLVIHGLIRDELHAWREQHRELYEKLETAMGKRRQPLAVTVTTAGDEESEIWETQYDFSVKVVTQAIVADEHFSFIAEVDKEDDIYDEANWPKANPMLEHGVVKIDHLRSMAAKSRAMPEVELEFRRYHCNQQTTSFAKVITPEMWATGNEPLPDIKGQSCFAGFDWGWRDDLAGFGLLFPLDQVEVNGETMRRYAVTCKAWIPEGGKRDLTREPWAGWIRDGWLIKTQGNTTDTDSVYLGLEEAQREYMIRKLAVDGNNCREFSTRATNQYGIETYEFFQSCKRYNEPMRKFLDCVRHGLLVHGGNPLLAWCALNLVAKSDAQDYMMPAKKNSLDKIDPIVALIMAFGLAVMEPINDSPQFIVL